MKIAVLVFAIIANVLMTTALAAVYIGVQTGHVIINFSDPVHYLKPEQMPQMRLTPLPTPETY